MNKYIIEVTEEELKAISHGVELWESEPGQTELMGAMFGAMIGPRKSDPGYEAYRLESEMRRLDSEKQIQQRKLISLRLRTKLAEVLITPTEFQSS